MKSGVVRKKTSYAQSKKSKVLSIVSNEEEKEGKKKYPQASNISNMNGVTSNEDPNNELIKKVKKTSNLLRSEDDKMKNGIRQIKYKDSSANIQPQKNPSLNSKGMVDLNKDKREIFFEPPKLGIPLTFQKKMPLFIQPELDLYYKGVLSASKGPLLNNPDIQKPRKLVFDCYEKSLYNSKFEYCKEVEFITDTSFQNYPLIASGKGAPKKGYINRLKLKPKIESYYIKQNKEDDTLLFESRFESGNLRRAVQISEYEYDLFLNPDISSFFTQFFYFKVANTKKGIKYRINIVNFVKPESLYSLGMLLSVYSVKQAEKDNIGWFRSGEEISYYRNNIQRKNNWFYYTLSFIIEFPYSDDEVYISSLEPYSFSDLQRFLSEICTTQNFDRIRHSVQCKTLCGNPIYILIITDFNSSFEEIGIRKAIILTSRIHPGETNSSFIIEGIIRFLIGNSPEAILLRRTYLIKIVPMLNPDGVIAGNYRCSLAAVDLNRQWIDPKEATAPEIVAIKAMIKRTEESRQIELFCDFHGHSRKQNIFFYGCAEKNTSEEQIFPYVLSTIESTFHLESCYYLIDKEKETTARVVVYREFNLTQSYTCEASLFAPNNGKYSNYHFSRSIYFEFAVNYCKAIALLINNNYKETMLNEVKLLKVKPERKEESHINKEKIMNDEEIKCPEMPRTQLISSN